MDMIDASAAIRRGNTLNQQPSRIIAHRGASGYLPEHSMAGYRLAVEQGADVIEPDLILSRDGVLYAHHDLTLSRTTDIATRSQWSARCTHGDWWALDFDAVELDQLRLIQRWPQRDHSHDGRYAMPRFNAMLEWIAACNRDRERPLKVYPEIKQPAYFRERGHDPVALLGQLLEAHQAAGPDSPVWLQCVDHDVLHEAWERCGNRCYALVETINVPDWPDRLRALATWACGVAPDKQLLWDVNGRDSGFVAAAHDLGLEVHAWTFREDADPTPFMHPHDELRMALSLGVDALFCDFPDTAVALRDSMAPT